MKRFSNCLTHTLLGLYAKFLHLNQIKRKSVYKCSCITTRQADGQIDKVASQVETQISLCSVNNMCIYTVVTIRSCVELKEYRQRLHGSSTDFQEPRPNETHTLPRPDCQNTRLQREGYGKPFFTG